MAAGEATSPDRMAVLRYALNKAIEYGHDPRTVRKWSEGDLIHFAHHCMGQRY